MEPRPRRCGSAKRVNPLCTGGVQTDQDQSRYAGTILLDISVRLL
jgi:hypothetical protein